MKKLFWAFVMFSVFNVSFVNASSMISDWVKVTQIRPFIDGSVYFDVDKVGICNTTTFLLKIKDDGSKTVYSTLLAAAMSEKSIKLETWGSCAVNGGWGTEVEAVYVKFH